MINNKPTYGYFLALCVVAVVFFFTVSLEQRNYQDAWILDGIVVPTAIFIFFFLVAETFVRDNKKVVILAASLLAAMNLVPGLKYQLFSGVFDAPAHFRFTDQIVSLGSIPENERLSTNYGSNPGMHIFMACVSIVSGIFVNDVFRFIIPALSGLVPFIVYFITREVLDNTTQRYVVLASSFPIAMRYIAYGTSLAIIPYFLLIAIFIRLVFTRMNKTAFWLLFVTLSFNIIASHTITALFVCIVLAGMLIILKSSEIVRNKPLGQVRAAQLISPCFFHAVLLFSWWLSMSSFNLNRLVDMIRQVLISDPLRTPVPTRFYNIPLLSRLQVLLAKHSRDAVVVMLTLFGLFVFLGKLRRNEVSGKAKAFYMFLTVLLVNFALFLFFEFASGFGSIEYYRFIVYALPLCVFLVGLSLWRLDNFLKIVFVKPRIRKLIFASLLFALVSLSWIQFYHYQPLVPRSNVLSPDLPNNEYIFYYGIVNTIYQKDMISFAEKHSYNSSIASDEVTRYQTRGFSSPSFFSRHVFFSPLEREDLKWDLFLLHTLRAGHLNEKAEYRTREIIERVRLEAGNVIYDNGESFIISHFPHNPNQDP